MVRIGLSTVDVETNLAQNPKTRDVEGVVRDSLKVQRNVVLLGTAVDLQQVTRINLWVEKTEELLKSLKNMGAISENTWRAAKRKLGEVQEFTEMNNFDAASNSVDALEETMITVIPADLAKWTQGEPV